MFTPGVWLAGHGCCREPPASCRAAATSARRGQGQRCSGFCVGAALKIRFPGARQRPSSSPLEGSWEARAEPEGFPGDPRGRVGTLWAQELVSPLPGGLHLCTCPVTLPSLPVARWLLGSEEAVVAPATRCTAQGVRQGQVHAGPASSLSLQTRTGYHGGNPVHVLSLGK